MYTVYTAQKLDGLRATQLAQENEMFLAQQARGDAKERPSGLAVVTGWFHRRERHVPRFVAAHAG